MSKCLNHWYIQAHKLMTTQNLFIFMSFVVLPVLVETNFRKCITQVICIDLVTTYCLMKKLTWLCLIWNRWQRKTLCRWENAGSHMSLPKSVAKFQSIQQRKSSSKADFSIPCYLPVLSGNNGKMKLKIKLLYLSTCMDITHQYKALSWLHFLLCHLFVYFDAYKAERISI